MAKFLIFILLLLTFATNAHEQTPPVDCPGDVVAFNLPTVCITGMTDIELERFGQNKTLISTRYGAILAAVIESYGLELSLTHFAKANEVELGLISHTMGYYLEHCGGRSYDGPLPVDEIKAYQAWIKQYQPMNVCLGLDNLGYKVGDDYFAFDCG